MLRRFHWSDITTVGHYLGVLVILTGMLMLIPALVALVAHEPRQLVAFVFSTGICFLVGALLRTLPARFVDRRCSILLLGFSWLAVGLLAAIPLWLSGDFATPLDALFDSVSALTTTGITVSSNIDHLSYAQIMWRSILTLSGAQAVVMVALFAGFFGEGGTVPLGQISLASLRRSKNDRDMTVASTWRFILIVAMSFMAVGTVAVMVFCMYLGLGPADAFIEGFCLVANALGTGGFAPHTSELIYYHSIGLEGTLAVFLLLGALNFTIYACACRHDYRTPRKDDELRMFIAWIIILVVIATVAITRDKVYSSVGALFSHGTYLVISAVTTGGLQTVYPQQFGGMVTDGILILLIVAALIGACSHSTGGGIKIIRVLQVLRWVVYSILTTLLPQSARVRVTYEHYGTHALTSRDAMAAMTIFILYLVTAALGSMAFIAHGYPALQSVFESVAYVSSYGATAGISGPAMSVDLKVIAILLMWAGRLEFIALIAAVVGLVLTIKPDNLFSSARTRALNRIKRENRGGTAWRKRKGQTPRGKDVAGCVAFAALMALALSPVAGVAHAATTGGAEVPAEEVLTLQAGPSYHEMALGDLLTASERIDGESVSFVGEAIGTPIRADEEHVWVNLRSNGAMVGVYMTTEQAQTITNYGRYQQAGDTLLVNGVYHIACDVHAGELEVHADSVTVARLGTSWHDSWSPVLLGWGAVLMVFGMMITAVQRMTRGKTGRKAFNL